MNVEILGNRYIYVPLQIIFGQYIFYLFQMKEQSLCASHQEDVHGPPQQHKNYDMVKITYHIKGENSIQAPTSQLQHQQERILQNSKENIERYRENCVTITKTRLYNIAKQYAGNCKRILENVEFQFFITDSHYLRPYTTSQIIFQNIISDMTTIKASQLKILNRQLFTHPLIKQCLQEILPQIKECLQQDLLICFIQVVQLLDQFKGHANFLQQQFLLKLHQISTDLYQSIEQLIFHDRSQEMFDNFIYFIRQLGEQIMELYLCQKPKTESNQLTLQTYDPVDYEQYFNQFTEDRVLSIRWRTIFENLDTFCEI